MTGLELLTHTEKLRREILRREERILTIRHLTCSLGHSLPGDIQVQTSPDPGRTQRLLDEAVDEEETLRLLHEERNAALGELALLISYLPDALNAEILQLRYLENLSWEEISLRIHLSRCRTFARHRQALEFLETREVKQLQ